MKHAPLILLLLTTAAFSGCATAARRASHGVTVAKMSADLPADVNERSVWLSYHVNTEESKFGSQTTHHWKENYDVFSRALIEKASSSGFDSQSLSQVLGLILTDGEAQHLAYLPIAAYVSELNGQPVWIVVLHWEDLFGAEVHASDQPLSHVRTYVFTQKDLKQVAFLTCG